VIASILFFVFAGVLLVAALGVITSRNPVYSALYLVLAFFNSAVLWLLLEAEFLAIVLVLVYVGAVMVLFLFVVMMLDINVENLREGYGRYATLGFLVALIVVAELASVGLFMAEGASFAAVAPIVGPDTVSNTKLLGGVLYTQHVYAFELAAVILLVAIVAAISLTMRRRPGLKVQNIAQQVAVNRDDRVRLVKVEPAED
jgi:NADH-quinone oxidoreductase subunit J